MSFLIMVLMGAIEEVKLELVSIDCSYFFLLKKNICFGKKFPVDYHNFEIFRASLIIASTIKKLKIIFLPR